MAKYKVCERKSNRLLLTFIIYDKKMDKVFTNQFKKIKQVNLIKVEE